MEIIYYEIFAYLNVKDKESICTLEVRQREHPRVGTSKVRQRM